VLRLYADEVLGVEGALTTKQEGLKERIGRNEDREAELENRMTLIERRLRAQYTALDAQMARLTGLSDFVTQQLSALSLNNNSN
jgi:flagellar hook-associated protein 2